MLKRVTILELSTDEIKENFVNFDAEIHQMSNTDNHEYEGYKKTPQEWADMLEGDTDFADNFKMVLNNADISEADGFTPGLLEDTNMYMVITLAKDEEGPKFFQMRKTYVGFKLHPNR